ncbi:MAG: hypothetical protein KAI63_07375 [Planctomycetes bacterium]|nr:hypothetical protein [Planctomycetota bacterium]
MTRKVSTFIILGLLGWLGACLATNGDDQPPPLKQLIQQSFQNLTDSQGYHVENKTSLVISGQYDWKTSAIMKGVHRNPDRTHIIIYWNDQEFEHYQIGEKMITRNPFTNDWMPVLKFQIPTPLEIYDNLKDNLKNFRSGPAEKINGQKTEVIHTAIDQAGLKKITENPPLPLPMAIDFQKAVHNQFSFWINETDQRPARIAFSVILLIDELPGLVPEDDSDTFDDDEPIRMAINVEMDFLSYDKDIDFKLPARVRKILEKHESKKENRREDNENSGNDNDDDAD